MVRSSSPYLHTPTYPGTSKPNSKPASVNAQSLRVSLASRLGFGSATPVEKDPAEIGEVEKDEVDMESQKPVKESLERPLIFISAVFVGLAVCLITVLLLGFGGSALLYQSLMDGNWMRMALLATTPFFGLFGLVSSASTPICRRRLFLCSHSAAQQST